MKKILYIATTANNRNRLDGETIKCRLLRDYLNKLEDIQLIAVDTDNWKKHIFKLIFLIIFNYIKCDKIVISSANKGSHIVLRFLEKIKSKKDTYYFVIGGSLYRDIIEKKWKASTYNRIKQIYVEVDQLKDDLDAIDINNVEKLSNFRKVEKFKNNYKKTDEVKFVFYGRVIKEKGIEEAINLVNRLNDENIKCTLDIYGQCKEDYLNKIKEIFTDKIIYNGEIKPDNKTEYEILSKYDVFLFPTEFLCEGLPGALIDAYISGLAVVASNWKYAKEYIHNNENGVIFEFKNYDDMFEKTKNMILNNKIDDYKLASNEISKQYYIDNVLKDFKNLLIK